MLVADFPLAYGGDAGVQDGGQDRLTQLEVVPQRPNSFSVVGGNRLQTERIKLAHLAFINEAQAV